MVERNIRLLVEYNGGPFSGWQIQNGEKTIQGEITEAIRRVTGKSVSLLGAGRTDAGVHARGQVANFHIDHSLESERYRDAINYHLPTGILIKESKEADDSFHSRFGAISRRYRYLLSQERSALYSGLRWERPEEVDSVALSEAAEMVSGEHDFSPFCVVSSLKENNNCQIFHSKWRAIGPLWVYEIRGNRFLHSMVRSLVGAMINLATVHQDLHPRNLTLDSFRDMLSAPATGRNPFTAPAHGLYLVSVAYKES